VTDLDMFNIFCRIGKAKHIKGLQKIYHTFIYFFSSEPYAILQKKEIHIVRAANF